MKVYEFLLRPRSGFGTPLAGDTVFGHVCWQLQLDSGLAGDLAGLLKDYVERPFAVFSSAAPRFEEKGEPRYAFPRPHLPMRRLFPSAFAGENDTAARRRKELKSRRWMWLGPTFLVGGLREETFITEAELGARHLALDAGNSGIRSRGYVRKVDRTRNTIDRLTGTTGKGFPPFTVSQRVYAPNATLSLFAALEERRLTPDAACEALRRIGMTGYGRDASVGLGRFDVERCAEVSLGDRGDSEAWYTLGPCVPEKGAWAESFYAPVVRFGKHGAALALAPNPFKSPVIMAAEGSVFRAVPGVLPSKPYIGQAITGISKAESATVAQGYTVVLPFPLEAAS